jgi:D-3-phosphoglycerate dehydrogenase
MRVLAYDPYVEAADVEQVASLAELLRRSDVVSLHARASARNEQMVDERALAMMRPGALLINTARETLLDEDALDRALASGHLGGAALDVFRPGALGSRPRLLRHANVILTPHLGGATFETLRRGAEMIAAEIERVGEGKPLVNVVSPDQATGMTPGIEMTA